MTSTERPAGLGLGLRWQSLNGPSEKRRSSRDDSNPSSQLRTKRSFLRPRLWSKSSSHHVESPTSPQPQSTKTPTAAPSTSSPRAAYVPTHAASSFARSTALKPSDRRCNTVMPSPNPTNITDVTNFTKLTSVTNITGTTAATPLTTPSASTTTATTLCSRRTSASIPETNTPATDADPDADASDSDAPIDPDTDYALFLAAAQVADRSRFRTSDPPAPVPWQYPMPGSEPHMVPRSAAPAPDTTNKPSKNNNFNIAPYGTEPQKHGLRRASSSIAPTTCTCSSPAMSAGQPKARTLRRQSSWAVQRISEYIKPSPLRDIIVEE